LRNFVIPVMLRPMRTREKIDERKLRRLTYGLRSRLPGRLGRFVEWLTGPHGRPLRIPLGVLFLAGGLLGFLPVLGFWMMPLGILLIAIDVPFVRRWVIRVWPRIREGWLRLRSWWRRD
jgi:hypothetical protein